MAVKKKKPQKTNGLSPSFRVRMGLEEPAPKKKAVKKKAAKKKPDGTKYLGTGIAKMGSKGRKKALTRSQRELKKMGQ